MKTLGDRMTDEEIDEMMFEAEVKDGMINIHGKFRKNDMRKKQ